MTGRQLELDAAFKEAGLLGLLGMGSSPGKTNVMGAAAVRKLDEAPRRIDVLAAGRDLAPPDGFSVPYALRTLVDEVTMPPVVLRDREPHELEPLADGGTVRFPEPVGEAATIHTLHSEIRTFGDSFGCEEASFRLALEAGLLERLRELAQASDEGGGGGAHGAAVVGRDRVRARGRGRGRLRPRSALLRGHPADGRMGARRRHRVHRRAGRRGGADARARRDLGARRHAARALRGARAAVPGARATQLPVRLRAGARGAGGAMKVGVPTEIKPDEYRVAITPAGVRELVSHGHEVLIQAGAGEGSAISDDDFAEQGARIVPDAEAVFGEAEMILKVKEPQPEEVALLRPEHVLFTYLHLAPAPELTRGLCESGATCIAYETVEDCQRPAAAAGADERGGGQDRHPGRRLHAREAARRPRHPARRRAGVAAANVLVIGGGVVGMNAAFIAIGMEADVFVFDRNIDRLRELDVAFGGRASTVYSSTLAVEEMLPSADLVIGAVLIHGGRAPHVITREQLGLMKKRAVLVDVSIDQGGCFETSRPTTHSDPVYEVDGITHYCVTNMPGAGADHLHLRAHQRHAPVRAARSPTTAWPARSRATPACAWA